MTTSKPCRMRMFASLLMLLTITALVLGGCGAPQRSIAISDPYAAIDWQTTGRYKANFHTHTTASDGSMNPHEVIDRYKAQGHRILALTDHNHVTYPWQGLTDLSPSDRAVGELEAGGLQSKDLVYENRIPLEIGMIAIQGNELSSHHHTGSFFTDHNGTNTEIASLQAIGAKGGLAMLYHPGRYGRSTNWYVDLYEQYPHLIGLEVYNQGNRYPDDRLIWDKILTRLMPGRPVWGYSNDDMHARSHLGRNWSIMLLPEFSEQWVRRGLEQGRSYFVYSPHREKEPMPPVIHSIEVDHGRSVITIEADNWETIEWVSEGQIFHRGSSVDLARYSDQIGSYVRAKLRGAEGTIAGTQPFGIHRPIAATISLTDDDGMAEYIDDQHLRARVQLRNLSAGAVSPQIEARIGQEQFISQAVSLQQPGDVTTFDVPVPVEAINAGQPLDLHIDLGAEYGRSRRMRLRLPLRMALPVRVSSQVVATDLAVISVVSQVEQRPVTVHLTAAVEGQSLLRETVTVAPGEQVQVQCPLPASLLGQESELQVVAKWDRSFGLPEATFSSAIDLKNLAPVAKVAADGAAGGIFPTLKPVVMLDSAEDVFPVGARDDWQGPADSSAAIAWAWDGQNLLLTATVRDDKHFNTRSGAGIWNGDAAQLAINPPAETMTTLGLALTAEGVELHRWGGPDAELQQKAQHSVTRNEAEATTIYQLSLPLASLGIRPEPGAIFSFNIVLFDDDTGSGQKGWLQLAPGLAGGRNPSLYPRFVLAR